jgi:Glycosyl transferases group 1
VTIAISHSQASTALRVGATVTRVIHHGIDVADLPQGKGDGGYACFFEQDVSGKGHAESRSYCPRRRRAAKNGRQAARPFVTGVLPGGVKPLLSSDVEYLGELGEWEKLALLGGSFRIAQPIQWAEPFGFVMNEALATGTPVVATPKGSAPEIIEEGVTGFLRKDCEGLTKPLLAATELDRAKCRAVASQRFDSDAMVGKHLQLYADVLCAATPAVVEATEGSSRPKLTIGRARALRRLRTSNAGATPATKEVVEDSKLN